MDSGGDPLAFIIIDRFAEQQMQARCYAEVHVTNRRAAGLRPEPLLPNLAVQAQLLTLLGRQAEAEALARSIRQNPSPRTRWAADARPIWVRERAGLRQEATE